MSTLQKGQYWIESLIGETRILDAVDIFHLQSLLLGLILLKLVDFLPKV